MVIRTLIDNAVLLIGGAATAFGGAMTWRNRKRADKQLDTKIELDEAQKQQVIQGTVNEVEQNYLGRIGDMRKDVESLRAELVIERGLASEWRNRVLLLEDFFFTKHMPWDRKMTMMAREHNWEIDDPPSIMDYLKQISEQDHGGQQ